MIDGVRRPNPQSAPEHDRVMLLYLYPLRRMTSHRLVTTDLVHSIPLAVVAGLGCLFAGMVDWGILPSLLARYLPAIV